MSTTSPDAIQSGTYNVDGAHSNVGFEVRHMGIATVRGSFKKFAGSVELANGALTLSGNVDAASIDTGDEQRDGHLQSPEFFDAAQFPQITFTSTGAEPAGEGKIKLTGDITIKGTTKPIELVGELGENGQDPWGNERIGFEVEGKIDRREFGLEWNQTLPNGNLLLANDVKLVVSVSAAKAA
ncbi:MAG TPA: YceI family protein [Solirubrobacteraceae bacterium]|jgi:polyisoprenoid-binding protein YceI|nr:YceI family protein [Solirubrobacteraceae bacterium]